MKILAAVVTYNRCKLLSRCLDHLARQTMHPDEVLVINNGSSDGTVEMLQERGIRFVTQENVGSAGGWHRAIQYALEHDFDAAWLMDDDGFPDEDALHVLAKSMRPGIACASSVVVREDDQDRFVFPFPVLDETGLPILFAKTRKISTISGLSKVTPNGSYPFAHLFNGALVSVTAARAAGNIDRNFFMFGDEVDYFFRLRSVGVVTSVLAARHYHPDVSRRPYTPAKVYYYLKNTMVLNERYFDQVWLRHAAAIVAVIVRTAKRNGFMAAASLLAGRSAPMFYSAISRGLRGRVEKDFHG